MSKHKYSCRSKKRKEMVPVTYIEPPRKTLLDVIRYNMKIAHRVISVHRVIYIGDHTFDPGEMNSISSSFQAVVDKVNSGICDEYLTGFLLHYPKYFCHVVEASEKTLHKHFDLLFVDENIRKNLNRIKLLVAYHHINQRFLDRWTDVTGKPPTLMEKIDHISDLHTAMNHVVHCIEKLYKLGNTLHAAQIYEDSTSEERADPNFLQEYSRQASRVSTMSNFEGIGRPPSDTLPEIQLLEFLLDSPHINDLRVDFSALKDLHVDKMYQESTWPASTDFVPKNIFDKDFDPITDIAEKLEKDPEMV